jgi:diketogulonate reductase-like aldo/keto reductase
MQGSSHDTTNFAAGTGGLYLEEVKDTMVKAISVGYRMFDLAREYRNEGLAADAIDIMTERDNVYREDIFIISKVWPTDLGFVPTMDAIYSSLSDLRTNYIDMYLLHWPK